jgi:hypothetical protein
MIMTEILRQIGDIYWVNGYFYVGSPTSNASGRAGTKTEKALRYLLDRTGKEVSYTEIARVTGSRNPYDLVDFIGTICRTNSKVFWLERTEKGVILGSEDSFTRKISFRGGYVPE